MNRQDRLAISFLVLLALGLGPVLAAAQVASPEIEEIQEIPVISEAEIEELVGPIALYPDDLLAIVLPASTFPLQIVEAGRFLEDLEADPSLEPDEDWDDSVIALLNYPEVVELMNEDLDWTWRLGEAVVGQQSDVIAAIETFRDRAYAAGNLKSDEYQLVADEGGTIQITPVQEDIIYVPYYEPSQVVVYQPRPVYFYYPRPYPVYYYPYPTYYSFHDHFHHHWFWGVTTAFSIAWNTHHLSVYHHSFNGHPYYGHTYWDRWWYRRPDIHIHNNIYVRNNVNVSRTRYRHGDYWMPSNRRTVSYSDRRITRTRYYPNADTPTRPSSTMPGSPTRIVRTSKAPGTSKASGQQTRNVYPAQGASRQKIEFRPRPASTSKSHPVDTKTGVASRTAYRSGAITSDPKPASAPRLPRSSTIQPSSKPRAASHRPAAEPKASVGRPAQPVAQPRVARKAPSAAPRQASRPKSSSVKPEGTKPGKARPSSRSPARSDDSRPSRNKRR